MKNLKLSPRRMIAAKYRLERPLAEGGMGAVWLAWDTRLDVPVAIKFMVPALVASAHLVARFEREAKAAAQLRSRNVVQIYEHGVERGTPFIVMELLDGEDLSARMRRERRLTLQATARVVSEVCKALRRAHAIGIVHRDLKPANVFLARDGDGEEIVKVLDFGVVKSLAEAVESGVTPTGELLGTPHYMSPEQARNTKGVDHRCDLWSLGIIAYRALTGTLPFADDVGLDVLMRVISEPVPPPSSVVPDLGADVDGFFAKAFALAVEDRFQSAREMSAAMNELAGFSRPSGGDGPPSSPRADTQPPVSTTFVTRAYVYTSADHGDAEPAAEISETSLRAGPPPGTGAGADDLATRVEASPTPVVPEARAATSGRDGSTYASRVDVRAAPRAATSAAAEAPASSTQVSARDELPPPALQGAGQRDALIPAERAAPTASGAHRSRRRPIATVGALTAVAALVLVALAIANRAPHIARDAPPAVETIAPPSPAPVQTVCLQPTAEPARDTPVVTPAPAMQPVPPNKQVASAPKPAGPARPAPRKPEGGIGKRPTY